MGLFSVRNLVAGALAPMTGGASLLAADWSSAGGLLNDITGVTSSQNKTYQQQLNSMATQNQYNRDMWNLQNQYNSPVAQLARMREAGIDINPTSYALGTGNLSNTAVHVGSAGGFSGSGSPAGNPISMATGIANSIQDIRNKRESLELMKDQQEATKVNTDINRHNLSIAKKRGIQVGEHNGTITAIDYIKHKTNNWLGKKDASDAYMEEAYDSFFGKYGK